LTMADSGHAGPVNIGNPHEISMKDLAEWIISLTGSSSVIQYIPRPVDDPSVRRPDTTLAQELLDWQPQVAIEDALLRTIDWFRAEVAAAHITEPPLDARETAHILAGH